MIKIPRQMRDRPGHAGFFFHIPASGDRGVGHKDSFKGGIWIRSSFELNSRSCVVLIEETPGSGRFCRELRMGGSMQTVGFSEWSGQWLPLFDDEVRSYNLGLPIEITILAIRDGQ